MAHVRFWRRIKIFSWLYLNIGKRGISFTFGPKGIKLTKGKKHNRATIGLPGTGIYYVSQKKKK